MSESWLLWRDGTHDPFFNMSMDEVLLEEAPSLGAPLIRTYRWDRPSLSIGSSQLYPESEEARYAIVRRPTGGGNVYHDVDLTYTAVIPAGHSLTDLNRWTATGSSTKRCCRCWPRSASRPNSKATKRRMSTAPP